MYMCTRVKTASPCMFLPWFMVPKSLKPTVLKYQAPRDASVLILTGNHPPSQLGMGRQHPEKHPAATRQDTATATTVTMQLVATQRPCSARRGAQASPA